jgi:glycerol-3-phosphate acyltransferase PlsX
MFKDPGRGGAPVKVAVDTMGGDFGPSETVKGALQAMEAHNIELLLVGDQEVVEAELARYDIKGKPIQVVASEGKIGDDEHPIEGLRRKPKSSILVATKLMKTGDANVLVSMGSTGASMASSVFILGLMEGLERPCIGGPFLGVAPRTVLVDMGSNMDCRPSLMVSFGALGSVFSHEYLGIEKPRVGLLSVGSEAAKGNRQVHESYQLLGESHLNFIGNVEGMDFFTDRVDVIVCDGFVGNIIMKFTEGLGTALSHYVEQRLKSHLPAEELSKVASDLWETTNLPRTMGGPLFGVNGMVVIGHGSCRAGGIAGAIDTGVRCESLGMVDSMRQELARLSSAGALKS